MIPLSCHPSNRCSAVRAIGVRLDRSVSGALALTFRLDGDLARIRIPSPSVPRFDTQLWQHTCFEAFVALEYGAAYHELNFAPSGAWAVYAFRDTRDGEPVADETLAPAIAVRCGGDRLELDALVRVDRLSPAHPTARLRLGLSAVIEEGTGMLSCWALRHPGDKPDFHHPDAFSLQLEPPGREW
jgi:hypothetical protein